MQIVNKEAGWMCLKGNRMSAAFFLLHHPIFLVQTVGFGEDAP